MSVPPRTSVFLERRRYRRRRLGDLARLLPVIGAVLMAVPLLWSERTMTSGAMLYLFGLWAVLIVVTFVVSRALTRDTDDPETPARPVPPAGES